MHSVSISLCAMKGTGPGRPTHFAICPYSFCTISIQK